MPPKRSGRVTSRAHGSSNGEAGVGTAAERGSNDASNRKKPDTRGRRGVKGKDATKSDPIPEVFKELLAETSSANFTSPDRPLKRRKTGSRIASEAAVVIKDGTDQDTDGEEAMDFEDVLDNVGFSGSEKGAVIPSLSRQQTAYRDSDDEEDEEGSEYDEVDFGKLPTEDGTSGDLELTFNINTSPTQARNVPRRRVVSKDEKNTRLELHRMHVLCLLSHVARRNTWCNDPEVHKTLKSLLDKKVLADLHPKEDLSQFAKTEFLKRGLEKVNRMWKYNFDITARGLRRALWADEDVDLKNYKLPDDVELMLAKDDFKNAAKTLKGSRDTGAQLYCALLRGAGLDVRLVCSLQPLSFQAGGPSMPRSFVSPSKKSSAEGAYMTENPAIISNKAHVSSSGEIGTNVTGMYSNPRRRLGHPNAADYALPQFNVSPKAPAKPKKKPIVESPFPVFWVEILDEAHQMWLPIDPLVTDSIAKPRVFEPPMSDRENSMSYVIAFEDSGSARDVTKRYTKAFNAKTRKTRIESTPKGEKWWKRTIKSYDRGWKSDLDQIEDIELSKAEAREPMPKNIIDFKDHPIYALERHLKRNEVLVATQESGKVAAGRDSKLPGGKKMESVYRRRDVKIARSGDAWYRLGRDIKLGEQPVKTVPAKRRPDEMDVVEEFDDRPGTNLYTEDQTELYKAPPIVNGRVPRNAFGNIDIYVPSMVPKGGIHVPHEESARAARLLGIDYAEALTGFEFKGRHGTAVLKGVVVAAEYREAVEAVIDGFRYERQREREHERELLVLKIWRQFLARLRIKNRVDAYASDGEASAEDNPSPSLSGGGKEENESENDTGADQTYMDNADEEGGGFFPE